MRNNISFNSTLCKFGIGLFETIKVTEKPNYLNLHMDRLFNSIEELNVNFRYNREFIEKEIFEYIKENKVEYKALRVTVFDEGYNFSVRNIGYNEKSYKLGFKLNISPIQRGNSIINKHKTTNYFENIYTKDFANQNGFNDGIFLDNKQTILECSMSNIFFIKDSTVYTPSSELYILNGTMKKRIKGICGELNIKLKESKINISQIDSFDFVFISNSLMGIMKVTQIENTVFNDENIIFNKILAYLK